MTTNKNGWIWSNLFKNETSEEDLRLTEVAKLKAGEPVYVK